jgi:nitrogen-specific signal transduction histidine kinase
MGQKELLQERRRFKRLPLRFPVELKRGKKALGQAEVRDISPAGMRISLRQLPVHEGEVIWIRPLNREAKTMEVPARICWIGGSDGRKSAGIAFEEEVDYPLFFSALVSRMDTAFLASPLLQDMLDALHNPVVLLDENLSILALSNHFPRLAFDAQALKGADLSSIEPFYAFLEDGRFDFKQILGKALRDPRQIVLQAIPFQAPDDKEKSFFNITVTPIALSGQKKAVMVEVRDVSSLCMLKERINKREKNLLYQSRYFMLGQIFDELLDDIVNPLSAVVGRLDLLQMRIQQAIAGGDRSEEVAKWVKELDTINRLFDDVVEFCRVAAKRRERDKLVQGEESASISSLIEDALAIMELHSAFRAIRIEKDLASNLPPIRGDSFAWTNAVVYILQAIMKRMKGLEEKRIALKSELHDGKVALRITHNARALMIPIEKSVGFGVLDFLIKRYGLTIATAGSTGDQTISLYMEPA